MKRVLLLLMVLVLLVPTVCAEEERKLEVEIGSITLESEWQGETSDTHVWLVIAATLTNRKTEELDVETALGAELKYEGGYAFDGRISFPATRIEPLVVLEGTIGIRIPKLVADDLENASLSVSCEGTPRSVPLKISGRRSTAGRWGKWEGDGYDRPQDAVQAYLEALKQGSLSDIVATFAVETRAQRTDTKKYIERMRAGGAQIYATIPAANDYMLEIQTGKIYNEIVNALFWQYLCYTAQDTPYFEDIDAGRVFPMSDEDAQAAFIDAMSSPKFLEALANCEFVEWIDPGTLSEVYNSGVNQQNIAKLTASFGAEEMCDLAAHIVLNGKDYLQVMSCVRYGDRWYNINAAGNLSSILDISVYDNGLVSMEELGIS